MYSEQDFVAIGRRIRKNRILCLLPVAALLALLVLSLNRRIQWLAYLSAVLLSAMAIFGFTFYQLPCLRYRRFLTDIQRGLSREMTGRVVEISERAEIQDGARVLPVRLWLEAEADERIVYLNASKRAFFPEKGAYVTLKLCGRHILGVEPPRERTAI